MLKIQHLTPDNYQDARWSGGQTRQLYLYPEDGNYTKRQFAFRLSTATIDTERSDFTPLPGFKRILMTLDKEIQLQHQLDQELIQLPPLTPYHFDGGDPISSHGQCQDFNLIYQTNTYQGQMRTISANQIVKSKDSFQLIYPLQSISLIMDQGQTFSLAPQELLILEQTSHPQEMTLLFQSPQSSPHPCAIWTALT